MMVVNGKIFLARVNFWVRCNGKSHSMSRYDDEDICSYGQISLDVLDALEWQNISQWTRQARRPS